MEPRSTRDIEILFKLTVKEIGFGGGFGVSAVLPTTGT